MQLSEAARITAEALGGASAAWIDALPELVEGLAREWKLEVGAPLSGGSAALVLEVTRSGEPAVLKIGMPGPEDFAREAAVLRLAAGRSYPRLLAFDEGRRALLVERLGARMSMLGWPAEAEIDALCELMREAWRPMDAPGPFQSGRAKADLLAGLITDLWRELDRPCPAETLEEALGYAARRAAAHDPARCRLVHGDLHAENALQAPEGGFKLIDPDGLFCEPEYDAGLMMRDWSEDLLAGDPVARARARCARVCALTGTDPQAVWEWGFLERVSSGLYTLKVGRTDISGPMLAAAVALTGSGPA